MMTFIFIITNASYKGICVEFERKNNNTTLVFLQPNFPQVLKLFYDWSVKYYCWQFRYPARGSFRPKLIDFLKLSGRFQIYINQYV